MNQGITAFDMGAWERLCPIHCFDPSLRAIESYLDQEMTRAEIQAADARGDYPQIIFDRLRQLGVNAFFSESHTHSPSKVTAYHIGALSAAVARRSGSLAITLGVNGLALLPLYLFGTAEQCTQVFEGMQTGTFASLLLTEFENGSDLLRNKTQAYPVFPSNREAVGSTEQPTHFVLSGEKDLINGGNFHNILVVLAHTPHASESQDPLRDFSVFYLFRDESTISKKRWVTHSTRSADISGVIFKDTLVSREHVLGGVGNGFNVIQKTLMMSRGGVSVLGSGAASQALDIVLSYSQARHIYGEPLLALGAVSEILQTMHMMDLVAAAISLKATAYTNSFGPGAVHYTTIAKYLSCHLAEESVALGATVLSSRALLASQYETLLRDVKLYSIFDGTSLVILDQIQIRLRKLASRSRRVNKDFIPITQSVYQTVPNSLLKVTRSPTRIMCHPLVEYLEQLVTFSSYAPLSPLRELASILMEVTAKHEFESDLKNSQAMQFELAKVYALLEGLVAVSELSHNPTRGKLGMTSFVSALDEIAGTAAIGYFGLQVCSLLRNSVYKLNCKTSADTYLSRLQIVERQLVDATFTARSTFRNYYQPQSENDA